MPVVAIVDGIKILIYNDDHPPAHFHAQYAEYDALVAIETLTIIAGSLPRSQYRKVLAWARPRKAALNVAWLKAQSDLHPGRLE
jgi:hypothetical protein